MAVSTVRFYHEVQCVCDFSAESSYMASFCIHVALFAPVGVVIQVSSSH